MRLLTRLSEQHSLRLAPDNRVVVVLALSLILITRSLSSFSQLAALQAVLLLGMASIGVRVIWLVSRSLLVFPFTLAALPLIFTVPGETIFHLGCFTASQQGLARWLVVVIHCWLCYQALLACVMIAGPFGFIDGLAGLGLPKRLVSILRLALRYLDILLDEATRMRRARSLRGGPDKRPLLQRASTTGAMIGTLFLRSLDRADRVQTARACRGGPLAFQAEKLILGAKVQIAVIAVITGLVLFYAGS